MRRLIYILTFLTLIAACACKKADIPDSKDNPDLPPVEDERDIVGATIKCVQVDPLDKILQDQTTFRECSEALAAARGETASFQFAIRSGYALQDLTVEAGDLSCEGASIPVGFTAFVGNVGVSPSSFSPIPSKDKIHSSTGYYPDPLLETESYTAKASATQTVWISYQIPAGIPAGRYEAEVTFTGRKNGADFRIIKDIALQVYPVTVPEQSLLVYEWINGHVEFLNNGETPQGERYWELYRLIVEKARDYGHNVFMVHPINDCIFSQDGTSGLASPSTKYAFDWSRFDRRMELLLKDGKAKRIMGQHFAYRHWVPGTDAWYEPFQLQIPYSETTLRPFDDTARNFLDQFFPALYGHLEEKGWKDLYWQHIGDEPGTRDNAVSYNEIAAYVRNLVPDMKIMEAVHSTKEVCQSIDCIAPMLDYYDRDYSFYRSQQESGKELWFYTCMEPVGDYANRFLELPLVQTRLLHWINFKYGATGYLNWGFDSWRTLDWEDSVPDWGSTPAGDSWIVYPACNRVCSSIRLEAMRDGINDYELLKLLEQKNPAAAAEIANALIADFNVYDSRISAFREMRRQLLEQLSE